MPMRTKLSPLAAVALVAGLLASSLVLATPGAVGPTLPPAPAVAAATAVAIPAHELNQADLAAWLDGFMPQALNTAEVPGAVVVVVKDGKVLFEKGYGVADYARRIPVDANSTLFRPGSISKLFTWTAVMQLVEQGKIDLDADVNRYLDFKIPAFHGVPVTMRDLMTHRAGFSETAKDLISFTKAPPPLGDVLKRYVPPRIFAPAGGPGYSNYGASLAGYIVQRVSGEPFDDYVARHIFAPLDMRHSTFEQPLPQAMRPHMSNGYETWDKPGGGFEIIDMPPAGALSATGDDMSHFMIAHLQLGRYGEGQILKAQTAEMMHTSATKAFPDLHGNLLGFYQQNINGHRVIAHGGDTNYFHSDLSLFIDDNVGLFVSVNGKGKQGLGEFLRESLFDGFADRYFPAAPTPTTQVDLKTAKAHAAMIAGSYINTRRSDSTFVALVDLIGPTVVTADANGTISTAPLGQVQHFYETRPFLWQEVNGHDRIQAIVRDGKVIRWSSDTIAPIFVFVRPGGLAATGLEAPLAIASLALLALTAALWPIVAWARWRYGQAFPHAGSRAVAYRLVRLCAALSLLAIGLWLTVLVEVSSTNGAGVDLLLRLSQLVSLAAFAGGLVVALWNAVLVFTAPSSWFSKSYAVLLIAAFAVMLSVALTYHLIGVSGQY